MDASLFIVAGARTLPHLVLTIEHANVQSNLVSSYTGSCHFFPTSFYDLYVPMNASHLGHVWFALLHESMQYGAQIQGQHLWIWNRKHSNTFQSHKTFSTSSGAVRTHCVTITGHAYKNTHNRMATMWVFNVARCVILVVTLAWQDGHWILAGSGPTLTGCVSNKNLQISHLLIFRSIERTYFVELWDSGAGDIVPFFQFTKITKNYTIHRTVYSRNVFGADFQLLLRASSVEWALSMRNKVAHIQSCTVV